MIIAIDYGRRRVGVAGCHEGVAVALGLDTLLIDQPDEIPGRIADLLVEHQSREVVLGLPISLGDRPGALCGEIIALAEALQARGIVVHLVDEALSSRRAGEMLRQRGKRPQKADLDRVTAALLLQEFLDGHLPEFNREQIAKIKKETIPSP